MIAVSLKDSDELVDLLLRKGADVNMKSLLSSSLSSSYSCSHTSLRLFRPSIPALVSYRYKLV
jgi:hypothetical protein